MGQTLKSIRQTAIIGKRTREILLSSIHIPALKLRRIRLAGLSSAARGFSFVRHDPDFSQVLACVEGAGAVWVDGAWRSCRAGEAYVTSAGVAHAYRATKGAWKLCWAMYEDASLLGLPQPPRLVDFEVGPLERALLGLHAESSWQTDDLLLAQWSGLVDAYVRKGLHHGPEAGARLRVVWARVAADVAHPWTAPKLMRLAGMSETNLRRISIAETGRSPVRQVTHLRMIHARALLSSGLSVKAVAGAVGYENEFAFSTAFRREMKVAPVTLKKGDGGLLNGRFKKSRKS